MRVSVFRWLMVPLLMVLSCGQISVHQVDGGAKSDSGMSLDGGLTSDDAGVDAGRTDGGNTIDAGRTDAGQRDAGAKMDAGVVADAGMRSDAGSQRHVFTVLTINLWHDFPRSMDLEARTQAVADFIQREQPDIVATQEAGQGALIRNRCEVIGQRTGYQHRWVSEGGISIIFAEGPCVLSRWPILSDKQVDLPHPQVGGLVIRKALAATVGSPLGPVTMISTHLSNGEDAGTDRLAQTVRAFELVREYEGPAPVFLGGDFNSLPATDAMQFLRGALPVMGVTSSMRDAWLVVHPTNPGETASDGRIDYLYYLPGTRSTTTVLGCDVVLNQPVNGVLPSDHFGVMCRFEVTLTP